jgi:hypothetical protein
VFVGQLWEYLYLQVLGPSGALVVALTKPPTGLSVELPPALDHQGLG